MDPLIPPLRAAVAAGLVGLGLGLGVARHRASPGLAAEVADEAPRGALVVAMLQPDDCDSRIDALAPLLRAAESVGARVVVQVPGSADAAIQVRQRLAEHGWSLAVSRATPQAVRAMRRIGFVETPLVAAFDAHQRLVFAAPLPDSPEALVRWHALVPLVVPA